MTASDPGVRTAPQPDDPGDFTPGTARAMLGFASVGAAVSLTLGVYGSVHTPTGIAVNVAGFSTPLTVKVWLTSGVMLFALAQLGSGLLMFRDVPGISGTAWLASLHRWSGRAAFLLSVPVAMHCLYAMGFQGFNPRVLVHSLLGCLFYGVFTVKMLSLSSRRDLPGYVLPVLGGLVFALVTGLWFTSALWFFTTFGVQV